MTDAAHLRRGAGEIDERFAAANFDRDANRNRTGAEAVVVEKILGAISSRLELAERRDHQALRVVLQPVHRSFDGFASRRFHDREQALRPDRQRGNLRAQIALALLANASVGEKQCHHVASDFAAADNFHRRQPKTFLVNFRRERHRARRDPADIRVMRAVGGVCERAALDRR